MRGGDPRAAVGRFANHLRAQGFSVGFEESGLMLRIAAETPLPDWRTLSPLWRAAVCGNRREWDRFPEIFDNYWFPRRTRGTVRTTGATPNRRSLPERVADLHRQLESEGDSRPGSQAAWAGQGSGDDATETEQSPRAMGGASRNDPADSRPFAEWMPQDIERIDAAVSAFARRLRRVLLRRRESAASGSLDLRESLRAARATGGELLRLALRRNKRREPRIAVMVDVSRSMERHAPLFLRMARVFGERCGARVFVFHTRLAEVSGMLRKPGRKMQERINAVSFAFGGGTRIASTLEEALEGPLRGALGRRDLLLMCSDGFDADPPERLPEVLSRIRARGTDVIWLHPTRDKPASLAMQAGAASVRAFVPVHDMDSLARLPARL
jgi:uncharacterized protein with von Willebrand factor type A (vWA) domain